MCDMQHMTNETWHNAGSESEPSLPSFYGLGGKVTCRFGGKELFSHWMK